MSRVDHLRQEIQLEYEKNKYLLDVVHDFEKIRDTILDQVELFYNPSSLFTSDSEYSSSDDDIIDKSSDSDDAEFFVSKKAKKLAQSASRAKLMSQSSSTDFGLHSSSSSQFQSKKVTNNSKSRSPSTENLKKANASPVKPPQNQPNQQSGQSIYDVMQNPEVRMLYNIYVQTYAQEIKKKLSQNPEKNSEGKQEEEMKKFIPPSFQSFLQRMGMFQQQLLKKQNQFKSKSLLQPKIESNQEQKQATNQSLPQPQIQKSEQNQPPVQTQHQSISQPKIQIQTENQLKSIPQIQTDNQLKSIPQIQEDDQTQKIQKQQIQVQLNQNQKTSTQAQNIPQPQIQKTDQNQVPVQNQTQNIPQPQIQVQTDKQSQSIPQPMIQKSSVQRQESIQNQSPGRTQNQAQTKTGDLHVLLLLKLKMMQFQQNKGIQNENNLQQLQAILNDLPKEQLEGIRKYLQDVCKSRK